MGISLGDLATRFECELVGDPDTVVDRVATLTNSGPGTISFLSNRAYREQLRETAASAVILARPDADGCPVAALIAADPYATYARVATALHPPPEYPPGVHASAVVAEDAEIDDSAHVAAQAVVGSGARIGPRAFVGPGSVVGERCSLAEDVRLVARVTLVQDVHLGARTIVHPGAVVGSDGFGNARTPGGWLKVPQLGGVVVGADVEIGANTTVDRGAIDDTVIGDGVRLDNLIQIAHNVRIGEHTAIAAMVGISGSSVIGSRCLLAGQVGVAGHVTICDDVVVMGDAVVSKDIDEPGIYSGAFMAERDRTWRRKVARFRRIEDLVRRVDELEKTIKRNE